MTSAEQIEAIRQSMQDEKATKDELVLALTNLAHEMRFMLKVNPDKDGGLYRQRLTEAEDVLRKAGAL